jgi:phosphoglycerate dehydrogenase-like enzyme
VNRQHLVVVTEHLSEAALSWLAERCRVERHVESDTGFAEAMSDADGLIVRTYTNVSQSLLDRAPKLKVVGRAGVGLDNIDLAACTARGVAVVHTPDANTQAVVEYVLRLITEELRPIHRLLEAASPDDWKQLRAETVGRHQLDELTLGILGLGRIGRRMAQVGCALNIKVIYHDIEHIAPGARFGANAVGVDELFGQADILTVHIDGRPENRGVIDVRLIRLMLPEVIFINTSRGFVVDHEALASFLADNPYATALLDVHEPEPIEDDNPLLALANAKLFPHLASRTEKAMENMSWVVRDVWRVLNGEPPQWPA